MKKSKLKQIIKEEIHKVLNESYKVISKKTEKSPYENKKFDDYSLELNDEMYATPDGLTFQLKTIGFTSLPTGKELNLNEPNYYFYYIQTTVLDENGKELEKIPGAKIYGSYRLNASLNKAKKWLDQRGSQLISGKGFQHKST
jgi:hypothetical protein